MLSITGGIIKLNSLDSIIHPLAISPLNVFDIIPIIPKMREANTAHWHEKIRYIAKNPIEITKMVESGVSFFMVCLTFFLEKCINKRCNCTSPAKDY